MPCRTEEPYEVKPKKPMETVHGLEAALCGILTAVEKGNNLEWVMAHFDAKEAGISMDEVDMWWAKHKAKDEIRRQLEREAKEREAKKNAALAKLTKEERAILGLR